MALRSLGTKQLTLLSLIVHAIHDKNAFPRCHLACSHVQDSSFGTQSLRRLPHVCLHRESNLQGMFHTTDPPSLIMRIRNRNRNARLPLGQVSLTWKRLEKLMIRICIKM